MKIYLIVFAKIWEMIFQITININDLDGNKLLWYLHINILQHSNNTTVLGELFKYKKNGQMVEKAWAEATTVFEFCVVY